MFIFFLFVVISIDRVIAYINILLEKKIEKEIQDNLQQALGPDPDNVKKKKKIIQFLKLKISYNLI